jgi:MFS family permease
MAVRQYVWLARSRPIRLLLLGYCLAYAGDLAAFTAASVYVYHAGGAAYVGVLGLLKALPGAVLVPLVATWSDRVRRERLLVVTVAVRALLLSAAAAMMTSGAQAILVFVLVGLEAGLTSVFRQVQAALLPWLARTPDELTHANTAVGVTQSAATLGGPAVAAGLLAVGTAQAAMLAACGLTALAVIALTGVRPLSSQRPVTAGGRLKQLRLDMAAGFEAGIGRQGVLPLVIPAAAQTFARGFLSVLTVTIALNLFGLGSAGVGWLTAALGAGGVLAGPVAAVVVRRQIVARCFAAGVAGWGVPMILLAFSHAWYWPYLMFGFIGAANVFDDAGVYSALQQIIPCRLMGRALGVRRAVLLLSMGLGSVVAPLLINAVGARGALITTGLVLVVIAALSVRSLAVIDGRVSAPGPDLALLRQVSFFGPLPFAIVEHLAGELRSATYEPGDVIIQDGEPGERFYVIVDGRARVCKDGNELRQMGPGESFGEIALLRQVPRTATVIAMSRLQARTLARDEFLAAVTGNAASAEDADEVVSGRLQAG